MAPRACQLVGAPVPLPTAPMSYAYRLQDPACRAAYEAASAAVREAGEWFPDWFTFEHEWESRRRPSGGGSAIADDFQSLADGEGSLWQV